jgi:enediyne biosynthesis protein E4
MRWPTSRREPAPAERPVSAWRRVKWVAAGLATALIGSTGPASGADAESGRAWDLTPVPLDFVHFNGMSGKLYFPEMTGQGGALVDYDGDGDLDVYLVQGSLLGGASMAEAVFPYNGGGPPADVLLRNDATPAGPHWRDVTSDSGLAALGYGMSVTTGDFDGDGGVDLFVGNYGADQLWRNLGDGRFADASALLPQDDAWTTGGAFVDFDADGDEDLYIVHYVEYSVTQAPDCYAESTLRDYCGPSSFQGVPDTLLRNDGGDGWTDVSSQLGVGDVALAGLGVAVLDADGDGLLDLYVANDGQPNNLWGWRGGRWVDDALLAGVAVNVRGEPEASMGIGVADFDRDGDEDLVVTHLSGETNTLYVNEGDGLYDDLSVDRGLAAPSLPYTGFGVAWVDLDLDGWLDLVVVDGAVRIQEELAARGDPYPLSQTNLVFANERGRLVLTPETLDGEPRVHRGLVAGDVDGDGDQDLLLTVNAGPATVFESGAARPDNWLGVSLARPRHDGVEVAYADGGGTVARAGSSGSYASARDPRVVFGGALAPASLTISGRAGRRRLLSPPRGRYLRFE